jgi:septum formation protein
VILASASPRRAELLSLIGFPFEVVPAAIDESAAKLTDAAKLALHLAREKCRAVAGSYPDAAIIAADTIVAARSGEILGKPIDAADAERMLRLLSGVSHRVVTGVCMRPPRGSAEKSFAVETEVTFRKLAAREISAYVETMEPVDKAGAYGIQGIGASLIQSVRGSYTNVVGLPLAELVEAMTELGLMKGLQ